MELKSLPASTVRLIGSSQVITSVYSVVKELIENALDAQSTSVDIKLENFGLDKVEVRDNGSGIKQSSIPLVAKRYHTSKILSFADLEQLITYGFRGEALGSLCAVSDLSVTSKATDEEVSQSVTFDHHGNVVSTVPSHLGQGTTVCATHLFKNLPVRRQFYNTVKKKKEELKRVEDLLMWYGAIRPDIRIVLKHGKDVVWQKNTMVDVRAALFGILGRSVVSQLQNNTIKCEELEVSIEAYFPKPNSDVHVTSRSTPDRCFIAVNKRPVFLKEIDKVIRQHYCQHHKCESRYPVYYLAIECPSSQLDVNLDPNKTKVLLHNQSDIIAKLTEIVEELYGPIVKSTQPGKSCNESSETSTVNGLNNADNDFERIGENKIQNTHKITNYTCLKDVRVSDLDNQQNILTKQGSEEENVKQGSEEENVRLDETESKQVKDGNSTADSLNSLRISFYNKDKTADIKCTDLDSNRNMLKNTDCAVNVSAGISDQIETSMDGDIGLTQGSKGNFNLVDNDIECLLASQTNVTLHAEVNNSKIKDNGTGFVPEGVERIEKSETEKMNLVNLNRLADEEENIPTKEKIQSETLSFVKSNESNKENQISVDKFPAINSETWSRGHSERQTDGQTPLEPVKLLVPDIAGSKRPPSPTAEKDLLTLTPPAKKRFPQVQVDQPRIYDCVGNSNSDKYSAGFVAFSKQMRPKVVEDNPSADYDTITKLVQEKWSRLSDTNKQRFCMVGKDELEVLKKTVIEKKKLSQKIRRKSAVQVKPGLPSIKDQLLASSKTKDKPRPQIKTVRTPFNLENLKQLFSRDIRESQTQLTHSLHLIGPLKFYNGWVCCHGNKLQLLNPHRVEETLLYRDLLEKHVVPMTRLENPIRLTESNLGENLYHTLLTLFPTNMLAQTYSTAADERLVANGINVRLHQNEAGDPVLDLVGLSQVMPLYGVSDLVEILDLICNTKATSLSMARPLKVINYLQGEAVRMVRQRPLQRSHDDMVDLLDQMSTSLPDTMTNCLHDKPFLHDLCDLKTVFNHSSL